MRRALLLRPIYSLALLGLFAGCGQQVYEQRLEESRKYFAYIEKLDSNLGPVFKEGTIDELRAPLQFRPLPKPVPVKNADGEVEEPAVDPRQPSYLAIELPGLIAGWEGHFDITHNGQPARRPGYLYALSNAVLLITADPNEAADFTKNVLNLLSEALRVPQLDLATDAERETYPKSKSYTQPNNFDVYRFRGSQLLIDEIPHTVEVYMQRAADVQFCLVLVLPAGTDSKEKLSERIGLMLERLKINSKKQAPPKKPTAGGGPAPAATKTQVF
jgi:hypothetical protein